MEAPVLSPVVQNDAAGTAAVRAPAGSISFVITVPSEAADILPLLSVLETVRRPDDEIIVLIREGRSRTDVVPDWARVVSVPDVSIFHQRSRIPAVASKEWVVLLEDHIMVEPSAFEAIRTLIRERPDIDLIPFVAKNLTSTGTWDWAIFLFTFARVWGPLDHEPPFSAVTSSIVRRASLGTKPLVEGEWELRAIPRIFASGKRAYSNAICMDHIKPKSFFGAVTNIFRNARSGAELQLALGNRKRDIFWEGWYTFRQRPGELMQALGPRQRELPTGTRLRLKVLSFTHLTGFVACLLFGGGRAAYLLD